MNTRVSYWTGFSTGGNYEIQMTKTTANREVAAMNFNEAFKLPLIELTYVTFIINEHNLEGAED